MDGAVVPGGAVHARHPPQPDAGLAGRPGLALGLVLGDRLSRRHGEDARRHHATKLKLPFLGLVPDGEGPANPLLLTPKVPHEFGEAFRALRTSLVFSSGSEAHA